ncbi:uncharacterized protein PAC_07539 [Phialocephala subalpina]|uniref:Uncharacterized protein n=1 Tax=Phialocephala subalpina TaxID=576137 RepID=A0A1L7WY02_9HELO|nr:uncharacterized protein PAC_07539 [Phialocephala subalpina]
MDANASASINWGLGRVAKAPLKPGRTPLPNSPLQRPYEGMLPSPSPVPLFASFSASEVTNETPRPSEQQEVFAKTPSYDPSASEPSTNHGGSMKRLMQSSTSGQETPTKKYRGPRKPNPAAYAEKAKKKLAGELDKRVPVCPKGVVFWWRDNGHIDKERAVLNRKDESKLLLTLRDENGQDWQFPYTHATNFDWSDKKAIAKLNNQRAQVIRRRLDRPGDIKEKATPKAPWTTKEKKYLSNLVRKQIQKSKRAMIWVDWEEVTKAFNEKFEGFEMAKGEKISPAIKKASGNTAKSKEEESVKKVEEKVLTQSHVVVARNYKTIKAQFRRWLDEAQMEKAMVASFAVEGDNEAMSGHDHEEESDNEANRPANHRDESESESEEETGASFPNILSTAA